MSPRQIPPYLRTLPDELDGNALKIAQLAITLRYLLILYTDYYAQLLQEAVPFSSDIPVTVERMQSELSVMESHIQNLSNLLKTFRPQSPTLLKILNSDLFDDLMYRQAGQLFR